MTPRTWHCKECGIVVEQHSDHVGPTCLKECRGTFQHADTAACLYDRATLSHDDVICKEARP